MGLFGKMRFRRCGVDELAFIPSVVVGHMLNSGVVQQNNPPVVHDPRDLSTILHTSWGLGYDIAQLPFHLVKVSKRHK